MNLLFEFQEPSHQDEDPPIDFSSPEDILFEVLDSGRVTNETIIHRHNAEVMGAASYEQVYGGFLDFTVEDMLEDKTPGWFVMEGVTAVFHQGDGWSTDDDMDFYYERVRPATAYEIKQA